ncbi:MAG: DUF1559 domain-containing protein [Planctomycetes bacterium]|nr:DUF1559 domain-containing protein [Planctomycetota bacterium]
MHVSRSMRRGFTWVEMLVVILVIGVLVGLLLPAVQTVREAARRAACTDHLKQLGTALHNYASRGGTFPSASQVTRDASGRITAVDGWSWVMQMLPEMENKALYSKIDIHTDLPGDTSNAAVRKLLDTQLECLICPSYDGPRFANPRTRSGAITNYKAMGATHWESLSVNTAVPETPKYLPGKSGYHPDGALYPGSVHTSADFKSDGTSRTIMVTETAEPVVARWPVGAEATLVGLPPNVTIELPTSVSVSYYAPTGFDLKYGKESGLSPAFKTYLDGDYDDPAEDSYLPGKNQGTRGPSSHHPGVVNHLFVNANVQTVSTKIDPALYMFLITREGGDPTGEFFGY